MNEVIELFSMMSERYAFAVLRLLVFSSVLYLLFWKFSRLQHFRIPQARKTPALPLKEVVLTVSNLLLYMLPIGALYISVKWLGFEKPFALSEQFYWSEFFLSLGLMTVVQDATFYWMHRWMHRPKVFLATHKLHHQFVNPTPFGAYAFHMNEGLINIVPYAFILFLVPFNAASILVFTTFAIFWNCYLHLGYDPMTRSMKTLFYSSTHHAVHHQKSNCNYGLYFTFWDRYCGTEKI